MEGNEVANLFVTLTQANQAFIEACQADASALEEVAVASEEASAAVKAGAAEQAAAVEASATEQVAATEVSRGRMASAWSSLTQGVSQKWAAFTGQIKTGMSDIGKGIEHEAGTSQQAWARISSAGKVSGLALLAIGAESVKMASDFQSSMELIATQAGAGQTEVQKLSSQVLDLAPKVGMGPDKLAEGLYHIESAGFRGSTAMQILAAASKDAAIGQSDLETTSQALIGVIASQIGGVKDAADAAAYLNTTVGIGDMRMDQLAAAIATGVLPSFESAGLQMNDFSASLATLTDNVTPADEAATRLRMTVSLMSAPSKKAQSALESIGISGRQLADDMHKPDGLLAAVMDLKKHLEQTYPAGKGMKMSTDEINSALGTYQQSLDAAGVATEQQKTLLDSFRQSMETNGTAAVKQNQVLQEAFGGGRTSGAILTLIEESGRLQDKYNMIGDSASRAKSMQDSWAGTQATFKQQLHDVGAQLQVIGIHVGTMLLPPLTKLFGFLASHAGVMKVFFAVIIGGMLAFTSAVVANTIAMLADPVTWIVLAIVAAVAILGVAIYELVKHWGAIWGAIKGIALDVWHWLVDAWHDTVKAFVTAGEWVKSKVVDPIVRWFRDYLVAPIVLYLKIVRGVWEFVWGFLSVVIGDFKKRWDVFWAAVTAVAMIAWQTFLKPTFEFIDKYGIQPLKLSISLFEQGWHLVWQAICKETSASWDLLKLVCSYVDKYGLQPLHKAVLWLHDEWAKLWGGISSVVSDIWNNDLKPIFDKIEGAVNKAVSGFQAIAKAPGNAGSMFAHILGFDQGGWVPGSPGSPLLAVVHGGEFVVSRDMLAGRSANPIQVGRSAGTIGGGRPAQTIVQNHVHVYLDGKEIQNANMRVANRHRNRNGSNGYGG
jgi:TP901 family phage tail tape measure protein